MQTKLRNIATKFKIYGNYLWADSLKAGHINDTCLGVFNQAGIQVKYVFQRINHHVFRDPDQLMANMTRVLDHIRKKLEGMNDASRRVMTLVPTLDNKFYYTDPAGNYWRCYLYIERAKTYDIMESPKHAYQAALAFGVFQGQLSDMKGPRLYDTIADFHNTPKRLESFDAALKADRCNRANGIRTEIEFINAFRPKASRVVDALKSGEIPERITHNDTKLNNVMLDIESGEAVCVIDLDTVMPGASVYDFGDLVRSSVSPALEDERDLSKVCCRMDIYEALTHGFLDGCDGCLIRREVALMPFSAQLITYETGVRFLTDYLDGDRYFKVQRENHNLDRARTQFKLVQELMDKQDILDRITREYA